MIEETGSKGAGPIVPFKVTSGGRPSFWWAPPGTGSTALIITGWGPSLWPRSLPGTFKTQMMIAWLHTVLQASHEAATMRLHDRGGVCHRHWFSPSSAPWKSKIKVLARLVSGEALQGGRQPPSCCVVTRLSSVILREREPSGAPSRKDANAVGPRPCSPCHIQP